MSSPVLDRWALELQQFDIRFQHIQGKRNVVADAISRVRTLGLYQNNDNEDVPSSVKMLSKTSSSSPFCRHSPQESTYNVGKLNLEVLRKEQQWDQFCKSKVKDMKKKANHNFLLDQNSILRKVTKLMYTKATAIIVPRKLTSLIIIEFHNAKGNQGISRMVKIIRCYFWWVGMQKDIH